MKNITSLVQSLGVKNPLARDLFELLAASAYNKTATNVDRLQSRLSMSKDDLYATLNKFETIGLGKLILGRRGSKTRFTWNYELVSIGKVGLQMQDKLVPMDPIYQNVEEIIEDHSASSVARELVKMGTDQMVNLSIMLPAHMSASRATHLAKILQEFTDAA